MSRASAGYTDDRRTIDADPEQLAARLRERHTEILVATGSGGGQDRRMHIPDSDCDTVADHELHRKSADVYPVGYLSWCCKCACDALRPDECFVAEPPDKLLWHHFNGVEIRGSP